MNKKDINRSLTYAVQDPNTTIEAIPIDNVVFGEFTPNESKQLFISKVYTILWFQLLFTSFYIGIVNQVQPVQKFIISDMGYLLMIFGTILLLTSTCLFFGFNSVIKKYSIPFICFYTIIMSYIIGYVGLQFSASILLLAGIITLVLFSGLSLYAIQTKVDYTEYGGVLLSLLLCLITVNIMFFFFSVPYMSLIYSGVGSLLFSFYIIYDTQLIVGGNHRSIQFGEDDYALAAISLYTDIINLFLFLLNIIGGDN